MQVLRFIPGILIVVLVTGLISWQIHADDNGVRVLGSVSSGFFTPRAPDLTFDRMGQMLGPAAIRMIVGFVEASAIAKIYRFE